MRPIDKGQDKGSFKHWTEAQQPLQELLGEYCSYCERWVCSAIHVEHKLPKDNYPTYQFRWINYLLSCSNCNSTKQHGILVLKNYLWPDTDNTFLAFNYDNEGRVLPRNDLPPSVLAKAINIWRLVGLNRHCDTTLHGIEAPTIKDKRWIHRKHAWAYATDKKNDLAIEDTAERREKIACGALERGMFSVWMAVFADHPKMRKLLINKFTGTSNSCFDRLGNGIRSNRGQL